MSTLKVDSIESRTSGNRVVLPDVNNHPPFRNIVINGDMSIAQRGTSFANQGTGYTVDRWQLRKDNASSAEVTVSQSSESPDGFASSLKLDVTTALSSLASGDTYRVLQKVEAQNLQQLAYGTSVAKTLTISFWVKSNKTGIYTLAMYQDDDARLQSLNYTINSANTWEKKTLNISADTTGVINNDNGIGIWFIWFVAAGSNYTSGAQSSEWEAYSLGNYASSSQVNLLDNTSNEWYITGVQLEAGDSATPFEHLPVDVNLQRCYRYFYNWISEHIYGNIMMGRAISSSSARGVFQLPVKMRTAPSLTANGNFRAVADVSISGDGSGVSLARSATNTVYITFSYSGSMTTGQCAEMGANNDADAEILFDSEL